MLNSEVNDVAGDAVTTTAGATNYFAIVCFYKLTDKIKGHFKHLLLVVLILFGITVTPDAFALDYGDAPESYGVLIVDNGASHTVSSNLRLGGTPDNEADGIPTPNADGDDNAAADDEDGVTFAFALLPSSTSFRILANNILVTNSTGLPATLHAWVDFDNDGMFEATEYQSQAVATGTVNGNPPADLEWTGLSNLPGGTAYIRIRLAQEGVLTDSPATAVDERALGPGGVGEVEDYAISYLELPDPMLPPDTAVCIDPDDLLPFSITQVWDSIGTTGDISYGTPYAGDFNGDGIADLITSASLGFSSGTNRTANRFNVYYGPVVPGSTDVAPSLVLPTVRYEWSTTQPWAVADINPAANDGAEVVLIASNNNGGTANDRFLFAYNLVTGAQVWKSDVRVGYGGNDDGGPPGFADFNNDGMPEVYLYNQVFNAQTGVLLAAGGSNNNIGNRTPGNSGGFGTTSMVVAVDIDNNGDLELAAGGQIFDVVIANTAGTTGNGMPLLMNHLVIGDGYTMSADMDLDGDVDIIVLHLLDLYIYDGQTDTVMGEIDLGISGTGFGRALASIPLIGNLDLDPEPEIAVTQAFRVRGYDFDIGDPMSTTALSVAWTLNTSDNSGQTGITQFDFNKDGIQELVYRDETQLRIINALTQANVATFSCGSGTGHEYPIVADVDGDGRAEAATVCSNGVRGELRVFQEVLGTPQWASSPPVWNQFGYFRAHINDDLSVPQNQAPHWPTVGPDPEQCLNHNEYPGNTFRAQQVLVEPDVCPIRLAPFDWSDEPDSYFTTNALDGPRHAYCGDLQLGTEASVEDDGQPSPGADTDTLDNGVSFEIVDDGTASTFSVEATVTGTNILDQAAMLCGYLDGAADGTISGMFDRNVNYTTVGMGTADAGAGNEEICVQVAAPGDAGSTIDYPASTGFNGASASCGPTAADGNFECTLSFKPMFSANISDTIYSRFRLTKDSAFFSNTSPSPIGQAVGGEVESYALQHVPEDHGDAPDSYAVLLASNGPRHEITDELYLGALIDAELNGRVSPGADSDDNSDSNDDDGVASFPSLEVNAGDTYTVPGIPVYNATGNAARLCGWIDFDMNGQGGDGSFENTPPGDGVSERACVTTAGTVPALPGGSSLDPDNGSCTGTAPTFTCTLNFTAPDDFVFIANEPTFARFRVTTDVSFFTDTSPSPTGAVANGEVEDHLVPPNTLPVTLNHISSVRNGNTVDIDWGTSSELFNVGFQLWGLDGVDGQWEKLHNWLIRSGSGNAVEPQSYTKRIRIPASIDQLVSVGISSVDSDGSEHYYGPFELGVSYGELGDLAPIAWDQVRAELDTRMAAQGYTKSGVNGYRKASSTSTLALSSTDNESVIEFRVSTPGVYRITGSELPQVWHSAPKGELAVLDYQGNGVVRHVQAKGQGSGSTRALGSAGSIYFYSEGVNETQRLYSEAKVYRLALDSARALNAPIQSKQGVTSGFSDSYREVSVVEQDQYYIFHSAVDDPWLDEVVIGFSDKTRVRRQPVPVEADLLIDDSATLLLGLGRSSALGAIDNDSDGVQDAEHIVTGTVTDADGVKVKLDPVSAVGSGRWDLALPIPEGTLLGDANGIVNSGAFFNAGEGYAFSEVHIDSIGLEYSRPYVSKAGEDHLLFRGPDTGELGYSVTVPDTGWPWVFASDGSNLVRIGLESQRRVTDSDWGKMA